MEHLPIRFPTALLCAASISLFSTISAQANPVPVEPANNGQAETADPQTQSENASAASLGNLSLSSKDAFANQPTSPRSMTVEMNEKKPQEIRLPLGKDSDDGAFVIDDRGAGLRLEF